jgi:hypothetical protein
MNREIELVIEKVLDAKEEMELHIEKLGVMADPMLDESFDRLLDLLREFEE